MTFYFTTLGSKVCKFHQKTGQHSISFLTLLFVCKFFFSSPGLYLRILYLFFVYICCFNKLQKLLCFSQTWSDNLRRLLLFLMFFYFNFGGCSFPPPPPPSRCSVRACLKSPLIIDKLSDSHLRACARARARLCSTAATNSSCNESG